VPSEISPTARALRALEVLQTRPGTTANELADRLGVTERAARRYVEILREAGIPVSSARGPHGGYRLGRGTRLPPVTFTQTEALGLVMAVLDSHPDPDGDDLVDTALGKVIRALPEDVGRQAAALREHASAAPDRYAARPGTAVTSDLVAAIAARRRVLVTYRGESGSEWVAKVDPWAVVVRYGRWYLLCHSHRADAVRTYRVDRVVGVEHTSEGFVPPDGLDPVGALQEHLGTGWQFTTRVVFDAPLVDVAPWVGAQMGRLEAAGDECVLVGSTRNPAMYAQEWLASVPYPFRVEGGPELQEAVRALAERLAAAVPATDSAADLATDPAAPEA
jgi:predicted DNA-binding transcriptional regulator YafY